MWQRVFVCAAALSPPKGHGVVRGVRWRYFEVWQVSNPQCASSQHALAPTMRVCQQAVPASKACLPTIRVSRQSVPAVNACTGGNACPAVNSTLGITHGCLLYRADCASTLGITPRCLLYRALFYCLAVKTPTVSHHAKRT